MPLSWVKGSGKISFANGASAASDYSNLDHDNQHPPSPTNCDLQKYDNFTDSSSSRDSSLGGTAAAERDRCSSSPIGTTSVNSRRNVSNNKSDNTTNGEYRSQSPGVSVIPSVRREPTLNCDLTSAVSGVIPDDTYTITQAINSFGFGKYQVKLTLLTGICWMSDSMEMIILSLLSPILNCEWHISSVKQALMTSAVFLGMMISSAFWGSFCDKYGRKTGLVVSTALLFYYGLLTSFSPNFYWILFLRSLVGFNIACLPQSVTLYSEFLPIKQRGKCVILLECFWALGACFEVVLALFIMPWLGWRWLLGLSTIPVFLFLILCGSLPESVRYLAAKGDTEGASKVLVNLAKANGRQMLLGRLTLDDLETSTAGRGQISMLLKRPELRKTTLLLWYIWFASAFCYYGTVLLTTEVIAASDNICNANSILGESCSAACKTLETSDYTDILWTSFAEFPGIVVIYFTIELIGRKKTMALLFSAFAISLLFLMTCSSSRIFLTIVLFIARGSITGQFQAAYVYTPEVYPTSVRALGIGTCSGMARVGAIITPFIAQVLLRHTVHGTVAVYSIVAVLAVIAALLLPVETKGKEMQEMLH